MDKPVLLQITSWPRTLSFLSWYCGATDLFELGSSPYGRHRLLTSTYVLPQVDALKNTLKEFYGKDPKLSADISRIVNRNHLGRLTRLLNENEKNVVIGGDWDEDKL